MATQLVLLDTAPADWKLDRRTCEIGRRGLAEARAALRRAVEHDARTTTRDQRQTRAA